MFIPRFAFADTPGPRPLVMFALALLMCVCSFTAGFASQPGAGDTTAGSSSRQLRKQALVSVPLKQLNQTTRKKIDDILKRPSLYRRLPVTTIATDPDHFRFLVRYPEVIVNIWKTMGVTQMTTQRTGPFTIDTNDGAGTISSLELVYGNPNLHIFYGTGTYEGPVIRKKLTGRCVLILRTQFSTDARGRSHATNQLDVFLKVDNATLGLIAKTIQPIVGPTADRNFTESLKFVQRLNDTTRKNGPGVQQMGNRLDIKDNVKQKYIEVAGTVFQRSQSANAKPINVPAASSMSSSERESSILYPTSSQARSGDGRLENGEIREIRSRPISSDAPRNHVKALVPPPARMPQTAPRLNPRRNPQIDAPGNSRNKRNSHSPTYHLGRLEVPPTAPTGNDPSRRSVLTTFSDRPVGSRPTGYRAPNYQPIKRF